MLVHPCTLEAGSVGAPDRTGHVPTEYLPENHTNFRGLVQDRTGNEINGPELGGTVIASAVVFAPATLTVHERDRIRHGDDRYEVLFVKRLVVGSANDHLEITCRGIRSGVDVSGS